MSVRVRGIVLAVVLTGLAAGCGPAAKVVVKGTVTLDGAALEDGQIRFEPEDEKGAPASATVTKGSFSAEVPPGPKVVQITASKVVRTEPMYAGDPNGPKKEIREEIIPAKYNGKSELKLEVKSGMGDLNYELKSK